MNINQAKQQIKNAIVSYFTKDEFGKYIIPIQSQRPVFLMGAPGIGKTAIMEQIAEELDVGLVSYSMTHHTRQSALGLPFIVKKNYGGEEVDVSEYTMSEIIASVYDMIELTGHKEGILFLDEINCVSETLAPVMLQFLQYKVFGKHRVPDGWIVVTAGNPPEYNKSVREFDIVTWDRLKRIDVEPVYDVWKEYAYKKGTHPSIITYLDIKKGDFYQIESTVDGKSFVTARGWSDLSDMIKLYEKNNIKVDEKLISQYVQNKQIAKKFATYYDLFNKYKSDYQIEDILSGKAPDSIKYRAKDAKFDERLSLLGLMLDGVVGYLKEICVTNFVTLELMNSIKKIRMDLVKPEVTINEAIQKQVESIESLIDNGKASSSLSKEKEYILRKTIATLKDIKDKVAAKDFKNSLEAFDFIKTSYNDMLKDLKKNATSAGKKLSNAFKFLEEVFGDGQEMLIFVTELTLNYYSSTFISKYDCKEYFDHNKDLRFYERQKAIIAQIDNLDLD